MEKTRIVLAQTYTDDLQEAYEVLGQNERLELLCVTEPAKGLALLQFGVDIFVTGQQFYGPRVKSMYDESMSAYLRSIMKCDEKAMRAFEDNEGMYGGLIDGNEIAECARSISPTVITLRYSMTPSTTTHFCGDLRKWYGHEGLAFLGNAAFLDAIFCIITNIA